MQDPSNVTPGAGAQKPLSRGKSVLFGLAVSAVTTVIMLLVLELALHVFNYPPKQTDHQRLFVEYDSVRGWRNTPGAEGRYITEEYDIALKYNSHGIRGPERPYAKPPGTYRIVLLGDSFIEGYAVALEQRVSEVLQRLLNSDPRPETVEVIALGTAGYSTDQELLWLEQEGLRYQPDVVVDMFYANDVWYNARDSYWRGGKPLFVFDHDTLALTNVPVPTAILDERSTQRSLRSVIEDNSKLYWLVAGALKKQPRLHALIVRWGLAEVPPEMVLDAGDKVAVPAEFNVYRTTATPEVALAWRTTEALLARMRFQVEGVGGHFLAFLIPLRGDIYTQESTVRATGSGGAAGWDAQAVGRRFAQICAEQQLRCIDSTARFRQAAATGADSARLYFRNDWHWNARGHALAAEILAEEIRGLMKREPTPAAASAGH
jgi:hypothetical protein